MWLVDACSTPAPSRHIRTMMPHLRISAAEPNWANLGDRHFTWALLRSSLLVDGFWFGLYYIYNIYDINYHIMFYWWVLIYIILVCSISFVVLWHYDPRTRSPYDPSDRFSKLRQLRWTRHCSASEVQVWRTCWNTGLAMSSTSCRNTSSSTPCCWRWGLVWPKSKWSEFEQGPSKRLTDWWFGTFFIFPIILGMSSSQLTNSIIFQRGGSTTNQLS